jgi:hypothetical protein
MSNPVRPESQILTSVLELAKDGLPKVSGSTLWREGTLQAKASQEYLNYEFGWLPLKRDIEDFLRVVQTTNELVSQYERGSGQRQRRQFSFPSTSSGHAVSSESANSTWPVHTDVWANPSILWKISRTDTKMWFSGAFRYYLAPSGIQRYHQLASKLYGVSLTPELVWNLAPWTWALDWAGNVGDIMSNISYLGPDAAVMEWGYMMRGVETVRSYSTTVSGAPLTLSQGHPFTLGKTFSLGMTEVQSIKTRTGASPYSFSASVPALTGKQSAILAAVGLSRASRG